MFLLKNLLYPIGTLILAGCNLSAANQKGIAVAASSYSAAPKPKEISPAELRSLSTKVTHYFDSTLLSKGFNGQMLVAKNGTIIFEKTMGFADLRTKDPLAETTSMHIASTGKTFTAMAILYLQQNGKLNINDTLGSYFPGFPYKGVTIQMLLSHRSGLPNYLHYLSAVKVRDTCYSNQDVLNSLYTLKPNLERTPGTRFGYSNTNFVLLALIIEKITGELFPVFMKKTFFDPLQMSNTFICTNCDTLKPTPSFKGNGRLYPSDQFDCTYGDKNLYTTAHDMLKWDQALTGGQLFKKETLDAAYTPLSNEKPSVHNYGLGWRMMNFKNGKKLIYHNGRWHGSNASFVRLLDENVTIIVIGNKFTWNIYRSAMHAANIFGNYFPGGAQHKDEEEEDNSETELTKNLSPYSKIDNSVKTIR